MSHILKVRTIGDDASVKSVWIGGDGGCYEKSAPGSRQIISVNLIPKRDQSGRSLSFIRHLKLDITLKRRNVFLNFFGSNRKKFTLLYLNHFLNKNAYMVIYKKAEGKSHF